MLEIFGRKDAGKLFGGGYVWVWVWVGVKESISERVPVLN